MIVSVMGEPAGVAIQFAGTGIELALLATFALWAHRLANLDDNRLHGEEWT